MYKALHGLDPVYMSELLAPHTTDQPLGSSNQNLSVYSTYQTVNQRRFFMVWTPTRAVMISVSSLLLLDLTVSERNLWSPTSLSWLFLDFKICWLWLYAHCVGMYFCCLSWKCSVFGICDFHIYRIFFSFSSVVDVEYFLWFYLFMYSQEIHVTHVV